MAINLNPPTQIFDHQQTAAELLERFSAGMTSLLREKTLSESDQKNFARTAEILSDIAAQSFQSEQQKIELAKMQGDFEIDYLRKACETLLHVNEKNAEHSQENLQMLRTQAEHLEVLFKRVAVAEQTALPQNSHFVQLKGVHPHFYGRNQLLEQIKQKLTLGIPLVLHGPPGMGKSETAITFANRHLQDYKVVWSIDAATKEQRTQGYRELAKALFLPTYQGGHSRNSFR